MGRVEERGPHLRQRGAQGIQRAAATTALLSIALALVLSVLQLGTMAAIGADYPPEQVFRDTVLKVPWAVIVCVSLYLAIALAGERTHLVALVALVAAPTASLLARGTAELAHAYTAAAAPASDVSPLLVAGIKGLEYAALALTVTWLGRRPWSAAMHHAVAGLLAGLVFGGALLLLTLRLTEVPLTAGAGTAWAVNEVLFPIGCALILSREAGAPRITIR